MCGIAGLFHYQDPERPVATEVLLAMTRALAHRGPDGEGLWSAPAIGLGHRRLAILDLTDRAHQPMVDPGKRFVLTYNGEIYNFRRLRSRLEERGHTFRSTGDSEVLLTAYREWGQDVVTKISGIFSFAIWDAQERSLFLARDPLGVKPLFYAPGPPSFHFASEVKAILHDPAIDRQLDEEALDAFFTLGYTPAPLTGLRNVRQLLPGHAALISEKGFQSWRYWQNPYAGEPRRVSFPTAIEEFQDCLDRVTRAQMVSDVPVVGFLSGGLDSAALLRAMKRADLGPVRAFTVGFERQAFDERDAARATARCLGVDLSERVLGLDAASLLPRAALHLEEPTADSSALAVYLLCQAAAEDFKVAMSGDGADELLAGYETYRATGWARRYRQLPKVVRQGLIQPLTRALPVSDRKYSLRERATRFTYGAELGPGLDHCAWRVIFTNDLKRRLYEPQFSQRIAGCEPLSRYCDHIRGVPPTREPLAGLLNADTEFYLPNDMLVKIDRMSMAHGLEVRVPFLDIEIVSLCANLPPNFKLHWGRNRKHILRQSLRGSIPESVLCRRKSGFNIPVGEWMRGSLGELLLDAASTTRRDLSRFLDLEKLRRLAADHQRRRTDHGHSLFCALMFSLWLDNVARGWKGSRDAGSEDPTGIVPELSRTLDQTP
jgi:asparagine synthase (glutamine-hydrolysing)